MRKILIVIDMQNDFIDGSLGTKEAVGIVEDVKVYAFNNVRICIPKSFAPLYMDRLKSLLSL